MFGDDSDSENETTKKRIQVFIDIISVFIIKYKQNKICFGRSYE